MGAGGAVGVFGKLPARRDYVQHRVEPRLLQLVDPWLQAAMTESRRALDDAWLGTWLTAPIWRFWLGPGLAGRPALGALMPSVDGVGRYFPLCALCSFDAVPPPETDEQAGWFVAVEALLLAALAEGGSYEALVAGLDALPAPRSAPVESRPGVGAAFTALREAAFGRVYDRASCWWVPSADGASPPRALLRQGMPAAAEFATMMAPEAGPARAPALGAAR